jgi:hypothetical protein
MTEDLKLKGQRWLLGTSILSTLNKNYDRREFCRLRKILFRPERRKRIYAFAQREIY